MPRARATTTAGELAAAIGAELRGDGEAAITGAASLESAGAGELTFFANKRYRAQLEATTAAAVILPAEAAALCPAPALVTDNPYAAWARALGQLFPEPAMEPGVHHSAVIGPDAHIDPAARIDAQAVVGARSRVEAGARIEAGTVVGADCRVGPDSRVGPNASLYDGTELGARVRVHAAAVLGARGFGLAPEGGGYREIPQVGRVVVEDDVEIGAGSTIDRAALDETRIGRGTKIDNLVQVGHNCRIGEHCVLSGQAGVSGSTEVGDHCTLAGQAGVAGHIRIPPGTTLTAKAGVISEIREPGIYSGFPHQPHAEWRRDVAALRHIRELRSRLEALERAAAETGQGES
ncbi:MAG TPA: UDP-3-O-(3-hydroxymyristoyl)glucosamine N-acyltransferase [Gammaproteobacteria bacterium]|nr:UDP-3-O-(3-hydroxymyristoyl)glucosamine N-acyltransferase [Gammaproteobacteria bacterium]